VRLPLSPLRQRAREDCRLRPPLLFFVRSFLFPLRGLGTPNRPFFFTRCAPRYIWQSLFSLFRKDRPFFPLFLLQPAQRRHAQSPSPPPSKSIERDVEPISSSLFFVTSLTKAFSVPKGLLLRVSCRRCVVHKSPHSSPLIAVFPFAASTPPRGCFFFWSTSSMKVSTFPSLFPRCVRSPSLLKEATPRSPFSFSLLLRTRVKAWAEDGSFFFFRTSSSRRSSPAAPATRFPCHHFPGLLGTVAASGSFPSSFFCSGMDK